MMRLSLMRSVVDGVLADGSSELATAIAAPWNPDSESVRFFRASANFIFRFRSGNADLALRFNAVSERDRTEVESELDVLDVLSAHGIRVPRVVPSRNGNRVERVATDRGTFTATAFEWIPGVSPDAHAMSDEQLFEWGHSLAELHRASASLADDASSTAGGAAGYANFRRRNLDYLVARSASWIADRTPGGIGHEINREYRHITTWLASFPQEPGIYGLIHFDYESDNLIWDGASATAVDFDDCAVGWRFADIAFALRDLFPEDAPAELGRYRLFMEGYGFRWRDAREIARLFPRFLRVHGFITLGRLVRALDLDQDADRLPEWVADLRTKLERAADGYRKRLSDPRIWTRRPGRVSSSRA